MVKTVHNIGYSPPIINIPPGKGLMNRKLKFGYEYGKNDSNLNFSVIPIIEWVEMMDNIRLEIARMKSNYVLETDGIIDTNDLFNVVVYTVDVFKNLLAISPQGQQIQPKDIPSPTLPTIENDLQKIVDWFLSE
jgi:hypothetical protein